MKTKLIYLASPYSHKDPDVMQQRFELVQSLTLELIKRGLNVFSPIAYSHQFAQLGAGGTFETWKAFDLAMVERCNVLAVLCIDGFNDSMGVFNEIEAAKELNIPVRMIVEQPVIDVTCEEFKRQTEREPKAKYIADPWIRTKTITWPRIDQIAEALR